MNKDTIVGTATELAGKAQNEFGKVTGNTGHQVKGGVKEIKGAFQKGWGEGKENNKDEA